MDMATPTETPEEVPPEEDSPKAGGYVICIACKPDGSYDVYKDEPESAAEPASEEAGEPGGNAPSMGQPETHTVDSLEEALKQVIRIHKQNPMDDSYSSQMSAGFHGESTTPY